jgi:hypothetical protein
LLATALDVDLPDEQHDPERSSCNRQDFNDWPSCPHERVQDAAYGLSIGRKWQWKMQVSRLKMAMDSNAHVICLKTQILFMNKGQGSHAIVDDIVPLGHPVSV